MSMNNMQYNGETRPIKFKNLEDNTFITMLYDYMGRRGGKLYYNSQGTWTSTAKFFYKDYTLIEESTASNVIQKEFVWDPTAGQATKPFVFFNRARNTILYYTHDANKNVTELVYNAISNGMGAHYEYDTFGNTVVNQNYTMIGTEKLSNFNPFRFSSEYHDNELGLVYYNYRHYNPLVGRWINRDPIAEEGGNNLYGFIGNDVLNLIDLLGLEDDCCGKEKLKDNECCHNGLIMSVIGDIGKKGKACCVKLGKISLTSSGRHQNVCINGTCYTFGLDASSRWVIFYSRFFDSGVIYGEQPLETEEKSVKVLKSIADGLKDQMDSLVGQKAPYSLGNIGTWGSNCRAFSQAYYNTFSQQEYKGDLPDCDGGSSNGGGANDNTTSSCTSSSSCS